MRVGPRTGPTDTRPPVQTDLTRAGPLQDHRGGLRTRGGIRVLVAAALAALVAARCPPAAHAQGAQLDGAPLNVFADGLGAIQVRQDGVAAGLFYDPDENPAHAGLEIKEGESLLPARGRLRDRARPRPDRVTPPTLADQRRDQAAVERLHGRPEPARDRGPSPTPTAPRRSTSATRSQNVSAAPTSLRAGALADLYVGNNDSGNGVISQRRAALRRRPRRDHRARLRPAGDHALGALQEGDFELVFDNFAADGLNNTVDSAAPDNGVGVEFAARQPRSPARRAAIDVRWLLAAPAPPGTVTPPRAGRQRQPGATAPLIEQLPPPVAGKTVNVSVRKGRVFIRIPPSKKFIELKGAMQIPVGATIDTTKGRVNLDLGRRRHGRQTQLAWFYDGIFKVGQTRGAKPITEPRAGRGARQAARRPRARPAPRPRRRRASCGARARARSAPPASSARRPCAAPSGS